MLPIVEIEKKLGYTFKDKTLLKEAFTHVTYSNRHNVKHNDRLEYLGDAVLQLVVTEWQYGVLAMASEGVMTKERQRLVCKNALDSAVDGLGVWEYLLAYGTEYNKKGKAKSSLFEAIVAAIYLDGGYRQAKAFVLHHGNLRMDMQAGNPKGELQEYAQARGTQLPRYETVKSGKDDSPIFHSTVYLFDEQAVGEGKTRKEAEATAATRLLWELTNNPKTK
jgi:ribonuclease-3